MVAQVILWSNGMIMVFDAAGEQVTELQGPSTPERRAAVLEAACAGTVFEHGSWNERRVNKVPRETWGDMRKMLS